MRPRVTAIANVLVVLEFLLVLGAFGGGVVLIAAPDGSWMGITADVLEGTPYSSYLVPGVALIAFNGAFPLAVAVSTLRRRPWAAAWGHVTVGGVLVLWIAVQVALIGYQHPIQAVYGVYGVVVVGLGLVAAGRGY